MTAARLPIDWDAQPLGREFDFEIAERLGCSTSAVFNQRAKRGIRPFIQTEEGLKIAGERREIRKEEVRMEPVLSLLPNLYRLEAAALLAEWRRLGGLRGGFRTEEARRAG